MKFFVDFATSNKRYLRNKITNFYGDVFFLQILQVLGYDLGCDPHSLSI